MPTLLSPPGLEELTATSAWRAGEIPVAYCSWMRMAEEALKPLVKLMLPGAADLPLLGQASNHGAQADRLESFARPCLWASHWLAATPTGEEELSREAVAEWFRRGLVIGTNPAHPSYWGPTANHHQHTVEMGALVLAIEKAEQWLWEPLTEHERGQVARWMGSVRGVGLHRNNHIFFGVLPLCFLQRRGYGHGSDRGCVLRWMDILESMHLGGGWFIDGMNESIDHYNSYAFHYYGLWWGLLYGELDPDRAQRWREWAHDFLRDYVHFFAATGEPVPFGRSLTYRFAAAAPFALAEKCGASPLPPGQARRLCSKTLRFFLDRKIRQSQGALSLGWTDEFPAITEAYSCAGSTYWAAKGLSPLLLDPSHRFWAESEELLPAEREGFSRPISQIGMVIRSHDGEVELLNAATSICAGNTAFGAYKWGRLSFRTGIGWEARPKDAPQPLDSALTAESRDGSFHGRQTMHPMMVEDAHIASAYALGERISQFNVQVESYIWWRGGWQLHWHRCHAWQPARLHLGAYSVASEDPASLVEWGEFPMVSGSNGESVVALQSLLGFSASSRRRTSAPRVHISAPHSLSLVMRTEWMEGSADLVALSYAGRATPQPWKVASSQAGHLVLKNAAGDRWQIDEEKLPLLGTES